MRTFLSSAVAACAALLLLAPTAANAEPASRLKIAPKTSAFYLYDGSPTGTGPLFDAVSVQVQLRDCPAGNYVLWMDLVQDGVTYPVASTALGVGEFSCTATGTAPQLSMGFYGNGLHPGTAQVIATVYRQEDGMPVLVESSRTVRIPAGTNQP
ncbi:MAG TPA: hypothetical protein VF557_19860 [Jatrophihabitans sp.]|jgi:hypothetical protein|uniref:hypothetical protein n=1 Tax=Jatrophihabitans sp. TaxID=1932789 RepID=UPI002F01F0FC